MPLDQTEDPDGRPVDLSDERWRHIIDPGAGHPELAPFRGDILSAVSTPDHRLPGRTHGEEWFYLSGNGPSRWIKVVVIYEGGRGQIITAFARRSLP